MTDTGNNSGTQSTESDTDDGTWKSTPVGEVSAMFGSLHRVAERMEKEPEEKVRLDKYWWKVIKVWYPKMHEKVYCVPPVHFYNVKYKAKVAPLPLHEDIGCRMLLPSHETDVFNDEAQQRVLRSICAFAKKKNSVMFVLSNVEFQNYLNKEYISVDGSTVSCDKPQKGDEGEIDVLIIDKRDGVFVLEVKATGYREDFSKLGLAEKQNECTRPLKKVAGQLSRNKKLVRRLLQDLDPYEHIRIRTGLVWPNLKRNTFKEVVSSHPDATISPALTSAVHVHTLDDLLKSCLCSDEMPGMYTTITADTMTDDMFQNFLQYWNTLKNNTGEMVQPMQDDVYEQIVARFCGPLTTVKVCTEKTMPRVKLEEIPVPVARGRKRKRKEKMVSLEVRGKAGAARETAKRFSELVLLEQQIEILQQHDDDFVHIEGPPGTGKTLMLLLKILIWLLHGNNMVWVLSMSPHSRSVIHVLYQQVRETLFARMEKKEDAEKIIEDRLMFRVMERPPHQTNEEYFEKRLHKWAKWATEIPGSKVRLVLDETGMTGQGQKAFFNQVSNCFKSECFTNGSILGYTSGLSVWSASVEKCGRPDYTRKPDEPATPDKFGVYWKLDMPLRCPPSVQRGLILVQESLDMDNVFGFDKDKVVPHPVNVGNTHYNQYHADGFPVHLIAHGDHTKAPHEIWYCEECGKSLAQYLAKTLRIGQNKASPLVGTDRPLEMRDVLIVATHNAFDKAIPIDFFLAPLNKYGLQVAVNKTREEGDEELPPDDKILVTDITSVHGLERAVIVVIPEHPNPTPPPATHDDDDEDDEDEDDEDEDDEDEDDEDGKADEGDRDHESMEEDDLSSDDEKDDVEMDQDPSQNSLPNASATTGGDEEIPGSGDPADGGAGVPKQKAWPYAECDSEKNLEEALQTLTDKGKQDVFYIGSRTVCQLILFHFGKGQDSSTSDSTPSGSTPSESAPSGSAPSDSALSGSTPSVNTPSENENANNQ